MTENILKRFLPPTLVDDIVSGRTTINETPKMETITVLFSDLSDFTRLSTELGPRRISSILNEHLEKMSEIAFDHDGTIDKFIGDGIMILFGAPVALSTDQQVLRAIACATAMREGLAELNANWAKQGLPRLMMRIGLDHGPAIVGSFGGRRRTEYTAIGSVVNIASRIESITAPGEIYFTRTVREFLEDGCWEEVGFFTLRGVKNSCQLFRLKEKLRTRGAA